MENEIINHLQKLKHQITTELEWIHIKAWDKERSIHGLIDNLIYKLEAEVEKRLALTAQKEPIHADSSKERK